MIGIKDCRTHRTHRLRRLFDGHRIGLVDGQESHVDSFERQHLGRGFAVACNVDARMAQRKHVTAILTLAGMELQMPLGGIVSRNRFDMYSVERFRRGFRRHRITVEIERFGRSLVTDDGRLGSQQQFDGRTVEMIVMRMRNEHYVGLRQMRIIGVVGDGIDIDAPPVEIDGQRGVFEKRERDRPSVARRHRIGRIGRRLLFLEQRDHRFQSLVDS